MAQVPRKRKSPFDFSFTEEEKEEAKAEPLFLKKGVKVGEQIILKPATPFALNPISKIPNWAVDYSRPWSAQYEYPLSDMWNPDTTKPAMPSSLQEQLRDEHVDFMNEIAPAINEVYAKQTGTFYARTQPVPEVPPDKFIQGAGIAGYAPNVYSQGTYWAKRGFGGPLVRTMLVPQQALYWGIGSIRGTVPEWYAPGDMFKRIFKPGDAFELQESVLTDMSWETPAGMIVNMGVALTVDPLNIMGGGATKVAKAKKILRGYSQVAPEQAAKIVNAVEKSLKTSTDAKMLKYMVDTGREVDPKFKRKVLNMFAKGSRSNDLAEKLFITGGELTLKESRELVKGGKASTLKQMENTLAQYYKSGKGKETGFSDMFFEGVKAIKEGGPRGKSLLEYYAIMDDLTNPVTGPTKIMEYFGKAEDFADFRRRVKIAGVPESVLKNTDVKAVMGFAEKNPNLVNDMMKESVRWSEKVKRGEVALGVGIGAGWGAPVQGDIFSAIRPQLVRFLEKTEPWFHAFKRQGEIAPTVLKPQQGRAVAEVWNNAFNDVNKMKQSYQARFYQLVSDRANYSAQEILKPLNDMGINPRDVMVYIEKGGGAVPNPDLIKDSARVVRKLFDDEALKQFGFREFGLLRDYLTKIAVKNKKGVGATDALMRHNFTDVNKAAREMGMAPQFVADMKKFFANPAMQVGNKFQLARSRGATQTMQKFRDRATQVLRRAEVTNRQDLIDKFKLRDRVAFYDNMIDHYTDVDKGGKGTFPFTLGPIVHNERYRATFGNEIVEFMNSPAGRKWGFRKGASVDEFTPFSEDLGHILEQYPLRSASSLAAGETMEAFLKPFGFKFDFASEAGRARFAAVNAQANAEGKKLVNLWDWINQNERNVAKRDFMLGKVGKDQWADTDVVNQFVRMADAFIKLENPQWIKHWDNNNRWWAKTTLFGFKTSYLNFNYTGDAWQRFLGGMDWKHVSGTAGLELLLAEGKAIDAAPYIRGGSPSKIHKGFGGKTFTTSQLNHEMEMMNIFEGMFGGEIFEASDEFKRLSSTLYPLDEAIITFDKSKNWESMTKVAKSIVPSTGQAVVKGEVPIFMRVAKSIEASGRASTYRWYRVEEGFSAVDAADKVFEIHFPYSKQNAWIRRFFPFYFWHTRNVPRQFKNFFNQPAKQLLPFKVSKGISDLSKDEPTDDAKSEYLLGSGTHLYDVRGKALYYDTSQLPPQAALEITGLLNSNNPTDAYEAILRNIGSMSGPGIQFLLEETFNRDLFTGRVIRDEAGDIIVKPGIPNLGPINIRGNKGAQVLAHAVDTFLTPYGVGIRTQRAFEQFPHTIAIAKVLFGQPFRLDDPIVQNYAFIQNEIGELRIDRDNKNREFNLEIDPNKRKTLKGELDSFNREMSLKRREQKPALEALQNLKLWKERLQRAKVLKDEERIDAIEKRIEQIYLNWRERHKRQAEITEKRDIKKRKKERGVVDELQVDEEIPEFEKQTEPEKERIII